MHSLTWLGATIAMLMPITVQANSVISTTAGPMQVTTMASGLDEPWGIDFLPDGTFLVTERDGRLLLGQNGMLNSVDGLPDVFATGQGGLLDVMVPRDFESSRRIWLSYAMPVGSGAATAAGFGRLESSGQQLEDFQMVFMADPARGGRHFGSRLVEAYDGSIFVTTGDRGTGPDGLQAQEVTSALGKVIRLARSSTNEWSASIVSRGHRNSQGAALAVDGGFFVVDHGAQGGDELNKIVSGKNYGWPVVSYGVNYGGAKIGEGNSRPDIEPPLHYWDPSIAPSGLMIYSGRLVPEWTGDFFFGSLNSDFLGRLDPDSQAETGFAEERLVAPETGRVRDVVEAPDGAIWFLSVLDGAVYRLAPL